MFQLPRPRSLSAVLPILFLVSAVSNGEVARAQPFTVNASRVDPYKNFKFRVKWDGKYVAGISKVSPLKRTTDVVVHREGGDPSAERRSPGRTSYSPIVLERGVTHDGEFERWADKVWSFGASAGKETSLKDFRKDISIELYNEAGQLVLRYNVHRCWVSEYTPLSELNADQRSTAIESITIQHEGWERDQDVGEPAEPAIPNK